ncbi:hypothetical protein C8R46DRAFT_1035092 [Mycena filopes]|nr:hypothetical protein C8R46DRAFT_1035092 [Mycena filopes]
MGQDIGKGQARASREPIHAALRPRVPSKKRAMAKEGRIAAQERVPGRQSAATARAHTRSRHQHKDAPVGPPPQKQIKSRPQEQERTVLPLQLVYKSTTLRPAPPAALVALLSSPNTTGARGSFRLSTFSSERYGYDGNPPNEPLHKFPRLLGHDDSGLVNLVCCSGGIDTGVDEETRERDKRTGYRVYNESLSSCNEPSTRKQWMKSPRRTELAPLFGGHEDPADRSQLEGPQALYVVVALRQFNELQMNHTALQKFPRSSTDGTQSVTHSSGERRSIFHGAEETRVLQLTLHAHAPRLKNSSGSTYSLLTLVLKLVRSLQLLRKVPAVAHVYTYVQALGRRTRNLENTPNARRQLISRYSKDSDVKPLISDCLGNPAVRV